MSEREFDLDSLLELRQLNRSEIEQQFNFSDKDVVSGVRYERAKGLDRMANDDSYPLSFYFRDKELVLLFVERSGLDDAEREAVFRRLGPPELELRSRAGKTSTLYVYPSVGFAFSAAGDHFDFIEAFPPTTGDAYQQDIYEEPGPFIR